MPVDAHFALGLIVVFQRDNHNGTDGIYHLQYMVQEFRQNHGDSQDEPFGVTLGFSEGSSPQLPKLLFDVGGALKQFQVKSVL